MDVPTPEQLGLQIAQARERRGMTQEALAHSIELERSTISKIESGARKVSAIELSKIARALHTSMVSFFRSPAPAIVSHRAEQGEEADSVVDMRLERLADSITLIRRIGSLKGGALPSPWERPDTVDEAENMGSRLRSHLRLDGAEPLTDIARRAAESLGCYIFSAELGEDTADAGSMLLDEATAVAVVNASRKPGRRRLSAVHELGHALVQDEYTVDWRTATRDDGLESRLDRFARAVLLPAAELGRSFPESEAREGLRNACVRIGSRFRVDMTTLAIRLVRDLSLTGVDSFDTIRQIRTTKSDFIRLNLVNPPEEFAGVTQPLLYQQAVLRLFEGERISAQRAVELLEGTVDFEDLPPRPEGRAEDIWDFIS